MHSWSKHYEIKNYEIKIDALTTHDTPCIQKDVHSWLKQSELAGKMHVVQDRGEKGKCTSPIFRADQGIIHRLRGIHRKHTNAYTMTTERKAALHMQLSQSATGW